MNMMVGGGMSASVNAANHNDTLIRRLKQQQLDQSDMLDFELHLADGGGGGGGGGIEGGGGTNADGANQDEALANGPAKQASFFFISFN